MCVVPSTVPPEYHEIFQEGVRDGKLRDVDTQKYQYLRSIELLDLQIKAASSNSLLKKSLDNQKKIIQANLDAWIKGREVGMKYRESLKGGVQ